jgi:phage host-nuclease inhibitor protein Gam
MNHDPLKLFDLADRYLEQAGELDAALGQIEARAEAELAPVRERWEAQLAPLRERRDAADRELIALCRTARMEFFAAADLVDLRHGWLIYGRRRVVRKARGVLALLESLKWEEAIKRTAKVRWEVLEGWPEARLISCGTERVEQETFAYELKTPDQITRDVVRRGVASLMEAA